MYFLEAEPGPTRRCGEEERPEKESWGAGGGALQGARQRGPPQVPGRRLGCRVSHFGCETGTAEAGWAGHELRPVGP